MSTQVKFKDGTLEANGLKFHYLDWGDPSASPIVCLHGLRGHAHTWDAFAEATCDHYRIIAVDQRGRGESDWAPDGDYSTPSMVADLREITRKLGLTSFVLIGHSMGGKNSMLYASTYPETVQKLVIVDIPPAATPDGGRIRQELANVPEEFDDFETLFAHLRKENPFPPEEVLRSRLRYQTKELPNGKIGWRYDPEIRAQWRENRRPPYVDLWPALPLIPCPTLLVRGMETDALLPEVAQEMVRLLPEGELVEVERAAHMVMEDNPKGFTQAVHAFLKRSG